MIQQSKEVECDIFSKYPKINWVLSKWTAWIASSLVPGDSDDLLDERFTDANGEFRLDGTTREMTTIEPQLVIYHDCDDGNLVRFDNNHSEAILPSFFPCTIKLLYFER